MKPNSEEELTKELETLRKKLQETEEKLQTLQKHNEESHASEGLTRMILDQSGEVIFVCDQRGRIIRASSIVHRFFTSRVLERPFDDVCRLTLSSTPHFKPQTFSVSSVLGGKIFRALEVTHEGNDGQVCHFLLDARPLLHREREILGCMVILTDITEHKKADEELRKAHSELEERVRERTAQLREASKVAEEAQKFAESIVETIREPLLVLSHDLRVISANHAFCEIFKVTSEETLGHYIYDLGNRQWDIPSLRQLLEDILPKNIKFENFEVDHEFPTIGRKMMLVNARQIYQEERTTQTILIAFEDITQRNQAEEALRKALDQVRFFALQCLTAQERERKLIATEIHDGIGSSLTTTKFKVEEVIRIVGENRPQTRATLEGILPMLQEATQEARRIQLALRPSMLDDIGILATINWFCRQFESTYSHIHIRQEINIEESDVPVSLRIVVYRVLQEAMNNIAKHSKADRISLSLRKMDGAIQLGIQDNGLGFDLSEAQSRISTSRGLGLDSMRERTELSGGSFSIESSKGAGTVIKATWPIEQLSI